MHFPNGLKVLMISSSYESRPFYSVAINCSHTYSVN